MIECTKFVSYQKNTLQGFANIYVPKWGVHFNDVTLHMKDGRRWVSFPSKEYKDKDGNQKYFAYVRFNDREMSDKFSTAVIKAIEEYCAKNADDQPKMTSGMNNSVEIETIDDLPF